MKITSFFRRILVVGIISVVMLKLISCATPKSSAQFETGRASGANGEGRVVPISVYRDGGGFVPKDESELAGEDPMTLLERSLDYSTNQYRDYTGTLVRQERIGSELKPIQTIQFKYRAEPHSVAMQWMENAPDADVVLYVHGRYHNHMLVRPTGVSKFLVSCVRVAPTSPQAMKSSLRPITQFGFNRNIRSFLEICRQAEAAGDLQLENKGIQWVEETGRNAVLLVRRLPEGKNYPADLTRFYIDTEYLIPVKVEGLDPLGNRIFYYVFKDLQFNTGLTEEDFTPQSQGLNCR